MVRKCYELNCLRKYFLSTDYPLEPVWKSKGIEKEQILLILKEYSQVTVKGIKKRMNAG